MVISHTILFLIYLSLISSGTNMNLQKKVKLEQIQLRMRCSFILKVLITISHIHCFAHQKRRTQLILMKVGLVLQVRCYSLMICLERHGTFPLLIIQVMELLLQLMVLGITHRMLSGMYNQQMTIAIMNFQLI